MDEDTYRENIQRLEDGELIEDCDVVDELNAEAEARLKAAGVPRYLALVCGRGVFSLYHLLRFFPQTRHDREFLTHVLRVFEPDSVLGEYYMRTRLRPWVLRLIRERLNRLSNEIAISQENGDPVAERWDDLMPGEWMPGKPVDMDDEHDRRPPYGNNVLAARLASIILAEAVSPAAVSLAFRGTSARGRNASPR